jgi:hypothetical protein
MHSHENRPVRVHIRTDCIKIGLFIFTYQMKQPAPKCSAHGEEYIRFHWTQSSRYPHGKAVYHKKYFAMALSSLGNVVTAIVDPCIAKALILYLISG